MSSKKKVSFYKRLDVKLAVWYTLTFLTIIILIFGFLDYRLSHNILKEIDRMLVDEAYEIINTALKNPTNLDDQLKKYEQTVSQRKYYQIAFQVLDKFGNPIYLSSPLRGFAFPFPNSFLDQINYPQFTTKTLKVPHKSNPFRLCTYYYKEGGEVKYVVRVVTYLRMLRKNISNFRENLLVAFLLAFLFGSVGGWFLSRQSLRPIDKITEATKRITAANLGERLPLQGTDDELDRLAMTINHMFRRLEESFQKLTQFTADAAHELRTPITAIKGETEV
ncbi:MAG: HAMP domain-containing protein, partial [Pseudomonadota bacterium]